MLQPDESDDSSFRATARTLGSVRRRAQSAKATCEAASKEKKLSGAAKTSFEQKCVQGCDG